MRTVVEIVAALDLDQLAFNISRELTHEDMIEFILALDEYAADYEFTNTLRDKLTEALELEDEAIE